MKKLIIAALFIMLSIFTRAQSTASLNVTLNPITAMTVTGTATLSPFTTESQIENGLITGPLTMEVRSNRLWQLTTNIANITSTQISGGPSSVSAPLQPSNVSYGTINGAAGTVVTFTPFTNATLYTSPVVVAKTGNKGGPAVTGNTFTLQYKIIPGLLTDPANYVITVTYTLSEQ